MILPMQNLIVVGYGEKSDSSPHEKLSGGWGFLIMHVVTAFRQRSATISVMFNT